MILPSCGSKRPPIGNRWSDPLGFWWSIWFDLGDACIVLCITFYVLCVLEMLTNLCDDCLLYCVNPMFSFGPKQGFNLWKRRTILKNIPDKWSTLSWKNNDLLKNVHHPPVNVSKHNLLCTTGSVSGTVPVYMKRKEDNKSFLWHHLRRN